MTWSGQPMSLETPLDELELSVRSYNALKEKGVGTVRDLVVYTPREIIETPCIGKLSLSEIKAVLAEGGFSLAMKDLPPPPIIEQSSEWVQKMGRLMQSAAELNVWLKISPSQSGLLAEALLSLAKETVA